MSVGYVNWLPLGPLGRLLLSAHLRPNWPAKGYASIKNPGPEVYECIPFGGVPPEVLFVLIVDNW